MMGIVCDVGHTIITGSVLNELLTLAGRDECVATLYDESRLAAMSQAEIDAWVVKVTTRKIQGLRGIDHRKVTEACARVSVRPGFAEFLSHLREQGIPVLFAGTVPELITWELIRSVMPDSEPSWSLSVFGSRLVLEDDCVSRPGLICTPTLKARRAAEWAREHGVARGQLVVIGDSIGDVPTMLLADRRNRYGIAGGGAVLENVAGTLVRDFYEISASCLGAGPMDEYRSQCNEC